MIKISDAIKIAQDNVPNGAIQKIGSYKNLYILQIFRDTPEEEFVDPFYSVDKTSGKFSEFSVLTDGDVSEVFASLKDVGRL